MEVRGRALVAAGALCTAFVLLTALVVAGAGGGLDARMSGWFAERRVGPLTSFFARFTDLGVWYLIGPIVALTAFWLARRGLRREAAVVALCTVAAWGLNVALKAVIRRPTPGPPQAVEDSSLYAFPSGHTMTTTAFVTALALVVCTAVLRDRGRPLVVIAAAGYAGLMGLSRVYLGVHWPSDVVAGWLLGAAFALATWVLVLAPRGAEGASPDRSGGGRAAAPARGADHPPTRVILFDWGNTLMVDDGRPGRMMDWPRVAAMPGAAEALAALHGRYRVCVATNADDSGAEEVMAALRRVGLARHIDRVFSSRDLGARKPDPAFYAAVLDALRAGAAARGEPPLGAGQVVMVGDSYENDVLGARAAGLRAFWFDTSSTGGLRRSVREQTAAAGTREHARVITDLRDLPRTVGPIRG